MARLEATAVLDIDLKPSGFSKRELTITVHQDFDVYYDQGIQWVRTGRPGAEVKAGEMVLWSGAVDEMTGWMRAAVDSGLKDGLAWDVDDDDAREALQAEQDWAAHEREHAAGRV